MRNPIFLWAATITAAAATATGGFFAAAVFAADAPPVATKTVTVDVSTGPQGETGPAGPVGPPGPKGEPGADGTSGAATCPVGFSFGEAVFIQQGKGPVTLFACIKD